MTIPKENGRGGVEKNGFSGEKRRILEEIRGKTEKTRPFHRIGSPGRTKNYVKFHENSRRKSDKLLPFCRWEGQRKSGRREHPSTRWQGQMAQRPRYRRTRICSSSSRSTLRIRVRAPMWLVI